MLDRLFKSSKNRFGLTADATARLVLLASKTAVVATKFVTRLTIGRGVLLNSTSDTTLLHMFVGGDFGIDIVALNHQGKRHSNYKKRDQHNGQKYYYKSA